MLYVHSPLDRGVPARDDDAHVAESMRAASRIVIAYRDLRPLTFPSSLAPVSQPLQDEWALLGSWKERPVFAMAVDETFPPSDAAFRDLREIWKTLSPEDAAILAHGRAVLHWRARNRFCPACGGACEPVCAGNAVRCRACGARHFPRLDPAAITLVRHGDEVLLARSRRAGARMMYSLLAGFVEPGETLEEAAAREVLEETGVRVRDVRYACSQPWPFPASLMIGFTAEAETREITIDPGEIQHARWFRREEVRDPRGFELPPGDSIARVMIETWMRE